MKKLIILLALALCLGACGVDEVEVPDIDGDNSPEVSEPETTYEITGLYQNVTEDYIASVWIEEISDNELMIYYFHSYLKEVNEVLTPNSYSPSEAPISLYSFVGKAVLQDDDSWQFDRVNHLANQEGPASGVINFESNELQITFAENTALIENQYDVQPYIFYPDNLERPTSFTKVQDSGFFQQPFDDAEININGIPFFGEITAEHEEILGEMIDISTEENVGELVNIYHYDGVKFAYWLDDTGEDRELFWIKITQSGLSFVRDIDIGDSFDEVLAKFPQNDEIPDDIINGFVTLYGYYQFDSFYGVVGYENGIPTSIEYMATPGYINLFFDEFGILTEMLYRSQN